MQKPVCSEPTDWGWVDNIFMSDPSENKTTHSLPCQSLTEREIGANVHCCLAFHNWPHFHFMEHEPMKKVQGMCWKHIHCLILHVKAEPLLPCVQPFHTRRRGKKKKKKRHLLCTHPAPFNGKCCWLQWKPTMEPYETANLNILLIPPPPSLVLSGWLVFFFGKPLPFIWKGEWSPLHLHALFIRRLWCPHASANMSKERHAGRINNFFVNVALFNA